MKLFLVIKKLIKKRKLLKKYKVTEEERIGRIHLYRLFKDNTESLLYFKHHYDCEDRCYERIKKLK